jgi:hypothetical protein
MMNRVAALAALAVTGSLMLAAPRKSEHKTVTGWVLDSACALTKGLSKPISRECALACGKNGSPLAILRDDGTIYWPISETAPAVSRNERLVPFAGKRVTATRKGFHLGGSTAIVLEEIGGAAQ